MENRSMATLQIYEANAEAQNSDERQFKDRIRINQNFCFLHQNLTLESKTMVNQY